MKQAKTTPSIASVIQMYLEVIKLTRSPNTALTYGKALKEFKKILVKEKIDPEVSPSSVLTEDLIPKFVMHLKAFSPATEHLYIGAVARFYKYLAADQLAEINWPRTELLIKQYSRKHGIRLPQVATNDIERVIDFVSDITSFPMVSETERLRSMRDRAFLLTLADTGLRGHEACNLRCGDLDWHQGSVVITGKGDKEAVVRFTTRAMRALKDYLSLRAELDGSSGKQLTALPLFARHDKGTGQKVRPITPTTGRNIVAERVKQALGSDAEGI